MGKAVGFIGFGRMGSALALGALDAGVLSKKNLSAFAPSAVTRSKIKKSGVRLASSIGEAVSKAQFVFICVKPQQMAAVLPELKQALKNRSLKPCVVSVAAGVTIGRLQSALGKDVAVIRVMPNTPALLKAGISGYSCGLRVSVTHEKAVKQILTSVGQAVKVSENKMDLVTALSGSGPAYAFYLAEALIESGVKRGMSRDLATLFVNHTLHGAGRMLIERREPAAELRRQVTSPGGTTAAAINVFDKKKFKEIVLEAVTKATRRSTELSRI